jgi:hypothetical protein
LYNTFERPKIEALYNLLSKDNGTAFVGLAIPSAYTNLVFAIGDLAHLAKSRLRSFKAVLKLEDLDLIH